MPAPIVLRNLTPETKIVPNPPAGQPVIATKAELRDGSRTTSGGGDPVDPTNEAQAWESRLNRTAAGTPDSSFDPATDISYIGAFYIPFFGNYDSGGSDILSKNVFGFKSPEAGGRNGPNGSLFITGQGNKDFFDGQLQDAIWMAEVQIPDFSGTSAVTDYTQLPNATVLQNFVNVKQYAPIPDLDPQTQGVTPAETAGALTFVDDKLFMSVYNDYDADATNAVNVLICNDAKDLANATYQGFLSRDFGDQGAVYAVKIPQEKQATFGATHFCGIFATESIMSRSSFGPALLAWNPAGVAPADTHISATRFTHYTPSEPIDFWGNLNETTPINNYFTNLLGEDYRTYLNSDPASRVSDPSTLDLPSDASLHVGSSDNTEVRCAFIPPGTDTVVFLGTSQGMKYGSLYKARSWEQGNTAGEASGWAPNSIYDHYNFIWTMNLTDIAGASSVSEPRLIQQSLFEGHDGQRWRGDYGYRKGNNGVRGSICGGDFDPDTGRLYVVHDRIRETSSRDAYVVSVYQIGGGN